MNTLLILRILLKAGDIFPSGATVITSRSILVPEVNENLVGFVSCLQLCPVCNKHLLTLKMITT
jgi:hypothetical protein